MWGTLSWSQDKCQISAAPTTGHQSTLTFTFWSHNLEPLLTISISSYLLIHVFLRYMKDKEPYQIKGLMLGYNLFQTVFSLWMFLEGWGFYMTGDAKSLLS